MQIERSRFGVIAAALLAATPVWADPPRASHGSPSSAHDRPNPARSVRVEIHPLSHHAPLGQPVWVWFSIANESDKPLTLTVPGTKPRIPEPEISLPLSHVFSAGDSLGVTVRTESGREWVRPVGFRAAAEAPILLLAARGSVGRTIDLRDYFPALRSIGQHRITWQPYGSEWPSASTLVTIASRKLVEIVTDEGPLTLELFYDDAPQTVNNFLELVHQGFYEGLTFHRLVPGLMIQGGCPNGDGTGVRHDGKRIPSEFNERVHDRGSVSMALLNDQPDSASSQFFICGDHMPDWDGRYTVFAHLAGDKSYETLDKLMATPVDDMGRPARTFYLRTVRAYDAPSDSAASN